MTTDPPIESKKEKWITSETMDNRENKIAARIEDDIRGTLCITNPESLYIAVEKIMITTGWMRPKSDNSQENPNSTP